MTAALMAMMKASEPEGRHLWNRHSADVFGLLLRREHCTIRIRTSWRARIASGSEAGGIVTPQLHQVCNIPTDAPQFRPREMPPLCAIRTDGDQHVELCGKAAQRVGVCREEPRDQALFIAGCCRLFLSCDGVADGAIRVVPTLLMCAQHCFNARGRGAKVMASLPRDGGGWQSGSSGRFRSRRVVVKARVVRLAGKGKSARGPKMRGAVSVGAVGAHLRYLERDGVTRDGERGRAYSALGDEVDARAFMERSGEVRHQFRFIVAPEDAAELSDLKRFTRDLMQHMESDLGTKLDWIAVDHHNTGHPHSHILVRGVLDDGRILNVAGDYIAHGIRHRASELMTLELGPQTEVELKNKLRHEVDADRFTRLDRMMIAEQREHGVVDLRPDAGESYLVRTNRLVLTDRVKRLESFAIAEEIEPGRWSLADRADSTLRAMGEREDILRTMHRALADHGLADARGAEQYVTHGNRISHALVGRVLDKGLAGDEMGERFYLVIDGVDGRTHYVETSDASRLEDIKRGHIVALDPLPTKSDPRPADLNIAILAEQSGGIYRPSEHLEMARPVIERQRGDPYAFIRWDVVELGILSLIRKRPVPLACDTIALLRLQLSGRGLVLLPSDRLRQYEGNLVDAPRTSTCLPARVQEISRASIPRAMLSRMKIALSIEPAPSRIDSRPSPPIAMMPS
ncbi:type IV secretory pathway VirD2 relaxase [Angulomicrobium tetraedrale]|uniref:Type IV secretory pathway VirD2 relaxase n=1 Tax=Ancylobacter tetraedralis TaxID=217068 RepID=A0A839Z4X2_9HYPH|nr:DUF3363 domain-containing protein [Ancylobacter tetraedralis]MBB3770043.1 type IV secretory pathway VirD2 relaxase [Ancylobacter tetraedralis]